MPNIDGIELSESEVDLAYQLGIEKYIDEDKKEEYKSTRVYDADYNNYK